MNGDELAEWRTMYWIAREQIHHMERSYEVANKVARAAKGLAQYVECLSLYHDSWCGSCWTCRLSRLADDALAAERTTDRYAEKLEALASVLEERVPAV